MIAINTVRMTGLEKCAPQPSDLLNADSARTRTARARKKAKTPAQNARPSRKIC